MQHKKDGMVSSREQREKGLSASTGISEGYNGSSLQKRSYYFFQGERGMGAGKIKGITKEFSVVTRQKKNHTEDFGL